jgi:L-fuconate dehydratase
VRIADLRVHDVRFPTSRSLDGSDAMNPDPDYSAAYVELVTEDGDSGYGLTFTIGRGNDVCVAAIEALRGYVVGLDLDPADLGEYARRLTHDSQFRWLGPEKGVMHLAAAALINAGWDLAGRRARLPVWRLLSAMTPDQIVDLVDWRYLGDALTPSAALDLLSAKETGKQERIGELVAAGYPAYTTSAGWLGYADEKVTRLAQAAVAEGFEMLKLKVGADLSDDMRRLRAARNAVGPGVLIAVDANQRWDVPDAIAWMTELSTLDPYWIEEPTSPDDILGHAAIRAALATAGPGARRIRVVTGEHVHNRVMFKQLLQAEAVDAVQIDACRVGGVNENVAILLLAAAFGVPVCPHAGGVGLCELVQHLSFFDYAAVSGALENRYLEYVDHLHEHFEDPVVVRKGRYQAPQRPGYSARILDASLERYAFPGGAEWRDG